MLVWPLWDYPHGPDRKRPTSGRGTKWHVSPADRTGRAKKNMNKTLCPFFSRIHLAGIIFQTFHGTYLGQWWCQEGLFVFNVYFFYNSSFALFSLPNRCYFFLFQGSISHCKMWCFTLFLRAGKNKQRNFPHKLCVGERACDGVPAWTLHGLVTLQPRGVVV